MIKHISMNSEERESKEANRFFVSVVERVLRRDPLLLPYFEDGLFKLIDKPDDDFMWFKPGISPGIRAFILERVQIVLGNKPEEGDEEASWLWEEREKVKGRLENDQELFPYILTEALMIRNSADGFKIEIDPDIPDDEAMGIIARIREILTRDFDLHLEPEEPEETGRE